MVSDQGLASLESRQSAATGQNGYHCSLDSPCQNGACCGISGWCGYGPTYCGDGCLSNCDAKAECGQYSETGNGTCPLNVCCSQFGFCGTTEDFCGTGCQSNCGAPNRPSGKGGDVRDNVFGYYESWKSSGSECGVLDPSQLPVEALKAINYAFAYITPGTYDIVPMPGESFDLITQVANAKMRNPDTKMWVSIGGWTFNDNHTSTQPVFSDISSSLQKQAAFARKLTEFMSQYGFDGVDLDWEYPGAGDRGGHGTADIKNFPVLLQIIKAKFTIEKKAWGLSITVPTSYWYLRWFDLPSIAQYIDFFNIMSYDLHGTWDSNNPIGSIAYAHTNLTEIDSALDLFWRENIDPSMVNLGLAFYGRSFELEDPSCREPGCPFKGPGAQGPCTKTAGILSYREIQNILNDENLTSFSVYDADAAVNYLVYNQTSWVSFDDRTTFQQKIDFANDRGLRGLFIWAVDQDTDDFAALKAVTGKDIAPSIDESSTLGGWDVSKCWITPCGIGCQQGFIKMVGLNQNREYDGCPNSGDNSQQRSLCCPPWGAPDPSTCQWHGTASECYGQCDPGEVLMATDNFGGGSWCRNGVKAFCCPATSGAAAVAACQWLSGGSCTNELPQQMSVIGGGFTHMAFCCPAEPVFKNCGWHGDDTTCTSNRCDVVSSSSDQDWTQILGPEVP
jgi:chitinase